MRDSLPAGFTLVPGTVKVNGVSVADPAPATGPVLAFQVGALATGRQAVLTYRLRAGVGSLQGDGVNRAIAYACNDIRGCTTAVSFQPVAQAMAGPTPGRSTGKRSLAAGSSDMVDHANR